MTGHHAVIFTAILSLAGAAYGAPITFTGILSSATTNPPTGSPGTGATTVTYDAATHLLTVAATFTGLQSPTTAAHIHCCVLPNGNAGVATTVPTFPGFPLGVTSGTYNQTLDLTVASSFNPAFVTASGGTLAAAEAALATGMQNGMTYFNIHTTMFPGGEIRAFLVPEPVSAMLVATALAGFWITQRKPRRDI